ncbi:MAG: helix-turn-helix transcriptional regulator [Bacilli bacterium]|nr:helix-turn-helix transcriptional regulator [Bacilli bacterium]
MNIKNNFARNLKYYIKIKKINRKEICNKLNIPASTLSDWINAKKFPRIESLEELAAFLNISELDLLEDKIGSKKFNELNIDDKLNNEDKTEILFNRYKENLTEYDKSLINCIILQRIKLYDEEVNKK